MHRRRADAGSFTQRDIARLRMYHPTCTSALMVQVNEVLEHAQSELIKCSMDKRVRLFVQRDADNFETVDTESEEVRIVCSSTCVHLLENQVFLVASY